MGCGYVIVNIPRYMDNHFSNFYNSLYKSITVKPENTTEETPHNEPYINKEESDFHYNATNPKIELIALYLCMNLASVKFYNSIVVFTKKL